MKRYYFFQTSEQPRGPKGELRPTLRALPGQTFEDGTPIDTNINIQAPKEAGSNKFGNRNDYPIGTYFCSTHLEETRSAKSTVFYTVYKNAEFTTDCDFHPVSADVDFNYVNPDHKSDEMNLAFVKFTTFGEQASGAPQGTKSGKKAGVRRPSDAAGKALPLVATWQPAYDDQVAQEGNLFVIWMRRLLNEMGIRTLAKRPKYDLSVEGKIRDLYSAGESLDTLCSRQRFWDAMIAEKLDSVSLANIFTGPLEWYLDVLLNEHKKAKPCTFVPRDFTKSTDVEDAAMIINTQLNTLNGLANNFDAPDTMKNLQKAFEDGWTLDSILEPAVITTAEDIHTLADALASGAIALPKHLCAAGLTVLDQLKADKKNACPKDKDGFHVDELVWWTLMRNIKKKKHTLLKGPTGCGKTELVKRICEKAGLPLTIIPMGTITEPVEQLIGKMDLDPSTNGTKFDWADFALAVQRPGVILLDEINRCPRNGNNILFSVLDGTATLVASGAKSTDQRNVKVNPDCVFFATANVGYEYTGTSETDLALKNRFWPVELDYLPMNVETDILVSRTGIDRDDARNIAIIATNIRKDHAGGLLQSSVSTRETLMCAEAVADGFDLETSLEMCFLPNFEKGADGEGERGAVRTIIAKRFNN